MTTVDNKSFVTGLYREILGRNPEKSGLEHHLKLLDGGMSREEMRAAIMASKEKQLKDAREADNAPQAKPRKDRAPRRRGDGSDLPLPKEPAGPGKPGVVRDGPGGFLWKPVSDSDGKLAVLLPEKLTNNARAAYLEGPDGTKLEDGRYAGNGNGGREHFRFRKQGGAYPPGTTVVVVTQDGTTVRFTVKDTGARND
ncbi:MAG: DUF4214 domain-containing protein [Candidatus Sericytochromatia bacterium]|nr:DUF4214 domain-containing protein [Candidatus Tanganyikabacteria bacterium]